MSRLVEEGRAARSDASRRLFLRKVTREGARWSGYVDSLRRALPSGREAPPHLLESLEALRHKRDSLLTKIEALRRHRARGWEAALGEYEGARRELHRAWRCTISVLQKESLFA